MKIIKNYNKINKNNIEESNIMFISDEVGYSKYIELESMKLIKC